MRKDFVDLTRRKFGRLTITKYLGRGDGGALWECKCDCGNKIVSRSHPMKAGRTKSCGCLAKENLIKRQTKHGEAVRSKHLSKEYRAWSQMKSRCYTKSCPNFKRYGARGIRVCARWLKSYKNFLLDMGRAKSRLHSLERNNNQGNYQPSNCRWATRKDQQRNTRGNRFYSHLGQTKCIAAWAEHYGMTYSGMRKKIRRSVQDFIPNRKAS